MNIKFDQSILVVKCVDKKKVSHFAHFVAILCQSIMAQTHELSLLRNRKAGF